MCPAHAEAPRPHNSQRSYQPRTPETTCLYGVVERNIRGCLADAQTRSANGYGYPRFVEQEFYKFLDCGILRNGFVRVQCGECKHDKLVAFSCKGRGFCPSCTARRMSNTAAHLVDSVLPQVPYRQWVLSFPRRVRFLLANDAALLSAVLSMALRKFFAWQKRTARRMSIDIPQTGAITFVQRFGSLLNLNVHFHSLLPDGVFQCAANGEALFRPIPPPNRDDIERLLLQIARAAEKLIVRHCEQHQDNEAPDLLVREQAQSLRVQSIATSNDFTTRAQRCAFLQGYSLHAERIVLSDDRDGLERLCRYGARAPIANSRLSLDENGDAILKLKRTYFDGRTHLKFSQLELLRKLAILIPPPWKNLTRYHGVFAPNHQLRPKIIDIGRPEIADQQPMTASGKTSRSLPWAMLLRRVFAIDVLQCDKCSGRMRIIAIIPAGEASNAILDHIERQETKAPPMATGPPTILQ